MANSVYIQLAELIVLLLGIAFAGWQLYQIKKHDAFDYLVEYTRRYSEILRKLPIESADSRSIGELSEEQWREVWAYLDLCGEEEFMSRGGYIPKAIWKEWKDGIQENMKKKLFQTGLEYWRKKGWIGDDVYRFLRKPTEYSELW